MGHGLLDTKLLGQRFLDGAAGAKKLLRDVPVATERLATLGGASVTVGIRWHPSGNWIAVLTSASSTVKVYSVNRSTGALTEVASYTATGAITREGLSWNANGSRLAVVETTSRYLRVLAFDSGAETLTLDASYTVGSSGDNFGGVAFHPDGDRVVVIGISGTDVVFRTLTYSTGSLAATGSLFTVETGTDGTYGALLFNSDGTRILVSRRSAYVANNNARAHTFNKSTTAYAQAGGFMSSGGGAPTYELVADWRPGSLTQIIGVTGTNSAVAAYATFVTPTTGTSHTRLSNWIPPVNPMFVVGPMWVDANTLFFHETGVSASKAYLVRLDDSDATNPIMYTLEVIAYERCYCSMADPSGELIAVGGGSALGSIDIRRIILGDAEISQNGYVYVKTRGAA